MIDDVKERILFVFGYDKDQNKISKQKGGKQSGKTSQLSAEEFLKFAQKDLINPQERRNIVNCLTNCKRAIDCQLDNLIKKLGYLPISTKKKWHFPQKIQFLRTRGVIAPRILEKVNALRNDLEHRYKVPTIDEAEEAFDIATLFIAYSTIFPLPSLNWGISGGIHVKFNYEEMTFNFFQEVPRKPGEKTLVDLGYMVKYGEPEFTELYDFFTMTVPNL